MKNLKTFVWIVLSIFIFNIISPVAVVSAQETITETVNNQETETVEVISENLPENDGQNQESENDNPEQPNEEENPTEEKDQIADNEEVEDKTEESSGENLGPNDVLVPNPIKENENYLKYNESYQTSLYTGAATYSYPFPVPPASGGFEPEVRIDYNSHGANSHASVFGSGWSLNETYVARDVEYSPDNTNDDSFDLVFNGQSYELIYNSSDNTYHTETESFLKIKKLSGASNEKGEYWEINSGDGTIYRLGTKLQSEVVCQANQPNVLGSRNYVWRWYIDELEDVNGNKIFYNYSTNSFTLNYYTNIYKEYFQLNSIEYSNQKSNKVKFIYESQERYDRNPTFDQGCLFYSPYRVQEVQTFVGANKIKSFAIGYSTENEAARALIKNIIEKDSNNNALPATKFEYNSSQFQYFDPNNYVLFNPGPTNNPLLGIPRGHSPSYVQNLPVDFNRDGFTDLISIPMVPNNVYSQNWYLYLNEQGTINTNATILKQNGDRYYYNTSNGYKYNYKGLGDLNGDGFTDIISLNGDEYTLSNSRINLSNNGQSLYNPSSSEFEPIPNPGFSCPGGSYGSYPNYWGWFHGFYDYNSDGITDLIDIIGRYNKRVSGITQPCKTSLPQNYDLFINNGQSLIDNYKTISNSAHDSLFHFQIKGGESDRMADVNGDGYTDSIYCNDASGMDIYCTTQVNNGLFKDFESTVNLEDSTRFEYGDNDIHNIVDLNGDNLPDFIYRDRHNASNGSIGHLILNGGDLLQGACRGTNGNCRAYPYRRNFSSSQDLYPAHPIPGRNNHDGLRYIDVNGDGLVDIMNTGYADQDNGNWRVYLNQLKAPSTLKKITNPLGGITEIEYTPSTQFDNTGGDGVSDLGNPMWVVTEITKKNNVTGLHASEEEYTYDYEGGMYDYQDREFRGFSKVTVEDVNDNKVEHNFHQDDALKGQEYLTRTLDSNGDLFNQVENDFGSSSTNNIYKTWLESTTTSDYDGQTTPKVSKVEYTYDQYNNPTLVNNLGDIAITGDEREEHTTYVYNTTKWILNTPSQSYIENAQGNKEAENFFYYDNLTYGQAPDKGRLTRKEDWLNGGTNTNTYMTYDSFGNVLTQTDPRNNVTTNIYDSTGTFVNSTTNALNQTSIMTYDVGTGNVLEQTDPNGYKIKFVYDGFGRIIKEIKEYDNLTYPTKEYSYTVSGTGLNKVIIKQRINHNAALTIDGYTYLDGFGRTLQIKTPAENGGQIVQNTFYNNVGHSNAKSIPFNSTFSADYIAPVGSTLKMTVDYDAAGRISKVTNTDNTFKEFEYDRWKLTTTDELGKSIDKVYDAHGNIIQITEYNGSENYNTYYTYNTRDQLLSITDNLNNVISFEYDTLGRNTKSIDPDMGTWTYGYDANGNLINQTDNRGITISNIYDALNRITNIDYPNDSDIAYTYDAVTKGTLSQIVDSTSIRQMTYDNRLRPISESIDDQIIDDVITTSKTYDAMDRVVNQTYPDNEVVSYTYNSQGQIETMPGFITNFNYDANNKITQKVFANNVTTNYTYRTDNFRLESIETSSPAAPVIQNLEYTYDNVGNILTINDVARGALQTFVYDDLNRILSAIETSGTSYSQNYSYNSIGNILNVDENGNVTTYGYGTKPHAVTYTTLNSVATNYIYDLNGNLLNDGTYCYGYNDANRLITVKLCSNNNPIATYYYDHTGERSHKLTTNNTTGETKLTGSYAGNYDIEIKSNGSTQVITETKYYYANNELVAKKVIIDGGAAVLTFHHNDHLGSASVVTNTSGNILESSLYYPYGEVRSGATEAVTGKYTYTGQEADEETGLMYYGARYYNPKLKRFVQADSILPDPYDPQQVSRYTYVRNNPLIYTDPSGHCATGAGVDTVACGTGVVAISSTQLLIISAAGTYTIACAINCKATNETIVRTAQALYGVTSIGVGYLGTELTIQLGKFNTWKTFEFGTDRKTLAALTSTALLANGIDPDDDISDKNFKGQNNKELGRSIKSLEKRIKEHQDKIQNPDKYLDYSKAKGDPAKWRQGNIDGWHEDIQRAKDKLEDINKILKARKSK